MFVHFCLYDLFRHPTTPQLCPDLLQSEKIAPENLNSIVSKKILNVGCLAELLLSATDVLTLPANEMLCDGHRDGHGMGSAGTVLLLEEVEGVCLLEL